MDTTSQQIDADSLLIVCQYFAKNIDEFPNDVLFRCNFYGRIIDINLTYIFWHNFGVRNIDVISTYFFYRKIDLVSINFFWHNYFGKLMQLSCASFDLFERPTIVIVLVSLFETKVASTSVLDVISNFVPPWNTLYNVLYSV